MIEARENKCILPRRSPALLRVPLLKVVSLLKPENAQKIPAQVLPYAIERKTELAAVCDVLYYKTTKPTQKQKLATLKDQI